MGREIRRVPLDFDWPLNKIWQGFINPYWKPCPGKLHGTCHNGYSHAGKWLEAICRFIQLIGEDAARGDAGRDPKLLHPYIKSWALTPTKAPLTEEFVDLITGLAGERPSWPFGGCLEYKLSRKLLAAAGISEEKRWGVCRICNGNAMDPAVKEAYEAWKETPPPTGDGWQVWETVSEGSPISPVFGTQEELVKWLVGQGYSLGAAQAFSQDGWCPSMVMVGGKLYKDIESCGQAREVRDGDDRGGRGTAGTSG